MKSQHHSFDIHLAQKYGIEEAILIHHFQFWIQHNHYKGKNRFENRTWMYQSMEDISLHFPYLNPRKVKHAINSLVNQGVLIKEKIMKTSMHQINYYAFCNENEYLDTLQISNKVYDGQNCPIIRQICPRSCKNIHISKDTKKKDKKEDARARELRSKQFIDIEEEALEGSRIARKHPSTIQATHHEQKPSTPPPGSAPPPSMEDKYCFYWHKKTHQPCKIARSVLVDYLLQFSELTASVIDRTLKALEKKVRRINNVKEWCLATARDILFRETPRSKKKPSRRDPDGFKVDKDVTKSTTDSSSLSTWLCQQLKEEFGFCPASTTQKFPT